MSRRSNRKSVGHRGLPARGGAAAGPSGNPLPAEGPPHARWLTLAVGLLLTLAVGAVFGQTLWHDFVNYDDDLYVYGNPLIEKGLTLHGIGWAFTHSLVANWHPLTVLSFMADAQCYGLKPDGYHLTNVLLHAIAVVLLFVVLREMTGALWRSAFVAAVFAIHPLHVESVAWVSERKDVLSAVFFMLTLLCYAKAVTRLRSEASTGQASDGWRVTRDRRAGDKAEVIASPVTRHPSLFYWLAVVLFAVGLMAKPMLVTLPFILLLLDYWPLQRFNASPRHPMSGFTPPRLLVEKIPFFILSAASCVATFVAQQRGGAVEALARYSLSDRLENVFVSYARYLGKTFWPVGLAVRYSYPRYWPATAVSWAVALSVGLSAAALWLGRRFPYVAVGWFWFVGMLVPVIGLMQVGNQSLADRYTYLPQIGLCLLAAWGAAELCGASRIGRAALGSAAGLILAALMAVAYVQTGYWKDSVSLWTHTLACTSENVSALDNLGNALAGQEKSAEAVGRYEEALQLDPDNVDVRDNLGNALAGQEKWAEAIQCYEQVLRLDPDNAAVHRNFGSALARQGQLDPAIQQYEQALQLVPDFAAAHCSLADALAKEGRWTEAVRHYERALQLDPESADAECGWGAALAGQGHLAEARQHYQRALELKPDYAEAHYDLGIVLAAQGKPDEAIPEYQRAILLKPDYAQAYDNLGVMLIAQGRLAEALQVFERAVQVQPGFASAHYNLGLALMAQKRLAEAVQQFEQAIQLNPDHANAQYNLGIALAEQGEAAEARQHFEQALKLAIAQGNTALASSIRTLLQRPE